MRDKSLWHHASYICNILSSGLRVMGKGDSPEPNETESGGFAI